jgi:hypothetical protein
VGFRLFSLLFVLAPPLLAVPAGAETLPAHVRPARVVLVNESHDELTCGLLYAHWYRQDFGVLAAGGGSVELPLVIDPMTQAVYVMNSVGHPMAVQDLFCSRPRADWSRAVHLDYRDLALRAEHSQTICALEGQTVQCHGGDR